MKYTRKIVSGQKKKKGLEDTSVKENNPRDTFVREKSLKDESELGKSNWKQRWKKINITYKSARKILKNSTQKTK